MAASSEIEVLQAIVTEHQEAAVSLKNALQIKEQEFGNFQREVERQFEDLRANGGKRSPQVRDDAFHSLEARLQEAEDRAAALQCQFAEANNALTAANADNALLRAKMGVFSDTPQDRGAWSFEPEVAICDTREFSDIKQEVAIQMASVLSTPAASPGVTPMPSPAHSKGNAFGSRSRLGLLSSPASTEDLDSKAKDEVAIAHSKLARMSTIEFRDARAEALDEEKREVHIQSLEHLVATQESEIARLHQCYGRLEATVRKQHLTMALRGIASRARDISQIGTCKRGICESGFQTPSEEQDG